MTPAFDRGQIPKRILTGLSKDGPAPLHRIYGFCGATDGGQQFFVRQELKQLTADCRVRRGGGDLYVVTKPVAFEPDPPAAPAADAAPSAPTPETAPDRDDHRTPAADTLSASEEPPIETDTQPAHEETETMQTQTNGSNGYANVKKAVAAGRPKPLKDFIVTLLGASDKPMSIEAVAKAAIKKGVTTSKGSVSVTLQNLARHRQIAKPETGMYAAAQVIYDAAKSDKKSARPKRTVDDVKKAALGRKSAASVVKKDPVKTKPRKAASKPGRQASLLGSVYARLDGKIAAAANDEKEAAAGIREIDAQMKKLKSERAALVAKRAAAQGDAKKLRGSRRKVAELEAGVADILKA